MRASPTKAVVAAMILGWCALAQAKKHSPKDTPLTHKTLNAPVESVYAAAVTVAGREWQVISSDPAAHALSFDTTNTRQETAGGYSTYSVSVTCAATPSGGTEVGLELTEHKSGQPSLNALVNKSQRRSSMLQSFWDGLNTALKDSAPQAPTAQPPAAAPSAGPPSAPSAAPRAPSQPAAASPPQKAPPPAVAAEPPPIVPPKALKTPASGELAAVTIKSTPQGADIAIDGKFFGDTPTTVRLAAGDYAISIEKAGYKPWKRTVTLTEGGTATLDATLEGTQ